MSIIIICDKNKNNLYKRKLFYQKNFQACLIAATILDKGGIRPQGRASAEFGSTDSEAGAALADINGQLDADGCTSWGFP